MNHLHPSDYSIGSMSRADLKRICAEAEEMEERAIRQRRKGRAEEQAVKTRTAVAIITKDQSRLFTTR